MTAGLRGQLRMMTVAAGATPDWTTMAVEGPTEAVGQQGRIWFEWTATVAVDGGEEVTDEALDAAIWGAGRALEALASDDTAPQFRAV